MQTKVERELPVKLMLLIALVQGLLLLWLHQSIELKWWPHQSPSWLFGFYAMVLAGPVMLLLGLSTGKQRIWFNWVIGYTLVLGLCGFYVGTQATPVEQVRSDTLLLAMVPTLALAVFKAQMYLQQKIEGGEFSYANLFRWSWRNFLTLLLALLFAGAFWGVLMLWAGLFEAIKIDFFLDLFTESWFYYPVLALAYGFGIVMFRRLTHVIDVITRLQQALMKYLLVVLVFVAIIFLLSLATTGLSNLWRSGGSALILWMQALILFFVNAVYQDDAMARPYQRWIHRFIYTGLLLLPIYSAISFYGLALRVEQYGWSVARCWAVFVWFFLAVFSLGYAGGIVKYRDDWLKPLSTINVSVGLFFMVSMLLVNSPLLDFRKVTVNSQLALLERGAICLQDFNTFYFERELARPGYDGLQVLREKSRAVKPESNVSIQCARSNGHNKTSIETREQFVASLIISSHLLVPEDLFSKLYEHILEVGNQKDAGYLVAIDLNNDQQLEYLFVQKKDHWPHMSLFVRESGYWLRQDIELGRSETTQITSEFYEGLQAGKVQVQQPKWPEMEIGGVVLRVK